MRFLLFLFILLISCERSETIVAKINGYDISEKEIDSYIRFKKGKDIKITNILRKKFLNEGLLNRYKNMIFIEDKALANFYDTSVQKYYEESILTQKLYKKTVAEKVISEEHIQFLYEKSKLRIKARQILIRFNRDARKETNFSSASRAEFLADSLYNILKLNPVQFNDLAKRFSDDKSKKGESYGVTEFSHGEADYLITDVIYAENKVGLLPKVIETAYGYHIVEVLQFIPIENKVYDSYEKFKKAYMADKYKVRSLEQQRYAKYIDTKLLITTKEKINTQRLLQLKSLYIDSDLEVPSLDLKEIVLELGSQKVSFSYIYTLYKSKISLFQRLAEANDIVLNVFVPSLIKRYARLEYAKSIPLKLRDNELTSAKKRMLDMKYRRYKEENSNFSVSEEEKREEFKHTTYQSDEVFSVYGVRAPIGRKKEILKDSPSITKDNIREYIKKYNGKNSNGFIGKLTKKSLGIVGQTISTLKEKELSKLLYHKSYYYMVFYTSKKAAKNLSYEAAEKEITKTILAKKHTLFEKKLANDIKKNKYTVELFL